MVTQRFLDWWRRSMAVEADQIDFIGAMESSRLLCEQVSS
jgi:hypothetical protein